MNKKKFLSLIKKEDDFIVREILSKKFFLKYERSDNGIKRIKGPYTLFLMKKRGLTTQEALKIVSQKLSVPRSKIGYAGLKDKYAVTYQYLTIKKDKGFEEENISLMPMGKTNRHISIGDIEGNFFRIRLQKTGLCKKMVKIIPNYFGFQRFGIKKKNNKIGLLLLKRKYREALRMINDIYRKDFRSIHDIRKNKLKFFVHAYQSAVFNKVLRAYVKQNSKPVFREIKIPGTNTVFGDDFFSKKIRDILSKDKIAPQDFEFRDLKFRCEGSERMAFVRVKDIRCKNINGITELSFSLPPGSYATTVLEVMGL